MCVAPAEGLCSVPCMHRASSSPPSVTPVPGELTDINVVHLAEVQEQLEGGVASEYDQNVAYVNL